MLRRPAVEGIELCLQYPQQPAQDPKYSPILFPASWFSSADENPTCASTSSSEELDIKLVIYKLITKLDTQINSRLQQILTDEKDVFTCS